MNKRNIEKMIPVAMDILAEGGAGILKNGKIPSAYSGYLDSYGPTIRLSGLMQAMSFYEKDRPAGSADNSEETKRYCINDFLLLTLAKAGLIDDGHDGKLIDLVKNSEDRRMYQSLVVEAVTACKLAMRTFPKDKGEGK